MFSGLFPYQQSGARFLAERTAALLADDMGLGKTPQAIAACDLAGVRSALVLCPGIARTNWQREFQKFQTQQRRVVIIRAPSDLNTIAVWCADVLIMSYSLLPNEKVRRWLTALRYDALICDEAHYLKERTTIRTKAVYGSKTDRAKGLAACADRVWLLTGTPVMSYPHELWTHIRALWPEMLADVGLRRDDFVFRFCATCPLTGKTVGVRRASDLAAKLAPVMLRRLQADVQPDLPELRWSHVTVSPDSLPPMPPELQQAAAVIEAALASARGDDEAEAVVNAEKMHLASLRKWTGVAKVQAAIDLLREDHASGLECCVVFCCHLAVMDAMHAALPGSRVLSGATPQAERQMLIDDFQAGRIPDLICQLSIASTALTLTRAAQVMFVESSWVPADMMQAAKRAHRYGQKHSVLAKVVSLAGSIDEVVSAVLVRKNAAISKIVLATPV